ncbi:helix-turn-helix domain-containing protein [Chryseobacterium sp. MYb328]|uniref:helix-turn-helix domain-containing protein n=1 Tax=Chryseobacterium sp. MYb328 TaxID=2745231 RepID=UPI0030B523E8
MKTKIKRTPSDLLDDFTIFIYNLRSREFKIQEIAALLGKDHSTIMYHLKKYEGLSQFNQEFKNRIKNFNEEYFLRKMNASKLLKKPIGFMPLAPVSAQFINTKPVQAQPLIKPLKGPENYNDKDREVVEMWLSFTAIGTTIVDTGTKMLKNKGLIHSRDGIFDLINAFKQLNKHFTGNENFDKKEIGIEDFIFSFLTSTEEQQNRVIKFQESLFRKA